MKNIRAVLTASLTWLIMFQPLTALGFKVDTHVWVAQQVLNDLLPDGRVTIGGKEYSVDEDILTAIRNNPGAYRMGSVGPDAFPDLVVPQITTHPGVGGAWQTDDWLLWMLQNAKTDEDRAFAYGYVSHAAADVFAHSYVNMYSGDIFLLDDDETEVEERHFALEAYIDSKAPPLRDHLGRGLGKEYENLIVPSRFLADSLVFKDTVSNQYLRLNAKFANHLVAMQKMRSSLDTLIKKTDFMPEFGPKIQSRIIEFENKLIDLGFKLNDLVGPIAVAQAQIDAAKVALEAYDDVIRFLRNKIPVAEKLADDLAKAQRELAEVLVDIASKVGILPFGGDYCSKSKWVRTRECLKNTVMCPVWNAACTLLPGLWRKRDNLKRRILDIEERIVREGLRLPVLVAELELKIAQKAADPANRLLDEGKNALAALKKVETDLLNQVKDAKALIDSFRRMLTLDVSPIREPLVMWRENIDRAGVAYMEASADSARELMKPKAEGSPLRPYLEWKTCWGPVFLGVPRQVSTAPCFAFRTVDTLKQEVDRLRESIGAAIWLIDPIGELKHLIEGELRNLVAEAGGDVIGIIAGESAGTLVHFIYQEVDGRRLNEVFSQDSTAKGLLEFGDMAARADADMHLTEDGHFNPDKFHAIHNAVVLAKLTLLRPSQLNQMVRDFGVDGITLYGPELYGTQGKTGPFNILIEAVRSIDGNHQWMWQAPPYPRRPGFSDVGWPDARRYGYPYSNDTRGFRLWADMETRKKVFNKIFLGPVAPGIEMPQVYRMSALLGKDYTYYKPTKKNPFPELNVRPEQIYVRCTRLKNFGKEK